MGLEWTGVDRSRLKQYHYCITWPVGQEPQTLDVKYLELPGILKMPLVSSPCLQTKPAQSMKKLALTPAMLAALLTFSISSGVAQDVEFNRSFVMMNQHQCDDMAGVMDMMSTTIGPVLDELDEEEIIFTWGVMTHAWGDEWNFNWYMITENHAGFVTAWSEFVSRVTERDPDWFEKFDPMCREHKDNLYTLHTSQ